ncbi:hypothetical protein RAM80_05775 [Pseudomonas sp. App30]|uniref:hypothetical protein n=1 Tax=Pseudomonas sp. App30 TaxID=3068990 RepID=UPI003A7FB75D
MTDLPLAPPALLFGAFAEEIDPYWRDWQVSQQQAAVRATVGDNADLKSALWRTLRGYQQAIGAAREACLLAARPLLGRSDAWAELAPGHILFDTLSAAHAKALRAEFDMMQALGQLKGEQASRLEALLDHPDDAERPVGNTLVADVALLGADGNDVLAGVMVITHASAVHDTAGTWGVQVYWPGTHGGLAYFESLDAFQMAVLEGLAEADPTLPAQVSFSYAPIVGNAFDVGLKRQWRQLHQHALAIEQGKCFYADADSPAASMQRWRQEALQALEAPRHDARDQAFLDVLFEHETVTLAEGLPTWLRGLNPQAQEELSQRLADYLAALDKAQGVLARDVPPRDEFAGAALAQRLQKDFGLQPENLVIDLPVSLATVRETVPGSGAPGTPLIMITRPSEAREQLSLVQLALAGIDEEIAKRLHFAHVESRGVAASVALPTLAQLRVLFEELDLPARYERSLRDAFKGLPGESQEAILARRTALLAPWQASLRLHGQLALRRSRLDAQALALLDNPAARLHWVLFKGTGTPAGSALAGAVLINDPGTGLTVLYLPDAPNGQVLTQHGSMAEACRRLVQMSLESRMVDYLAALVTSGLASDHGAYIREAQLRNFDGWLVPGERIGVASSVAEYQLNLQMGRLISNHRATARSQDQLWLEAAARSHDSIFMVIKVLVGLLPFAGSVVAVYDAFDSAVEAVKAFRRGEGANGLLELENMLASLVGAAMDILPGTVAGGLGNVKGLRASVRARQAQAVARLAPLDGPGHVSAFRGYESDLAIALLQTAEQGIYRYAGGQYILRGGHAYAVQWDVTYHTWRLRGTALKTYRQPVRLDARGQWQTHGAISGRLVDGGLAGGGAAVSAVADSLVERLPLAIQARLPRWLGDAMVRRQRRIFSRLIADERDTTQRLRATEAARSRFAAAGVPDEALRKTVVDLAIQEVKACERYLASLAEHRAYLPEGVYRRAYQGTRYQGMDRMQLLIRMGKIRRQAVREEFGVRQAAHQTLIDAAERGELTLGAFTDAMNRTLGATQEVRIKLLEIADFIHEWSARFESEWHSASLDAPRRAEIGRLMREGGYDYRPRMDGAVKAEILLKLVLKPQLSTSPERLLLGELVIRDVRQLDILLATWRDTEVVDLSAAQRQRVLSQFATATELFRWRLEEWTSVYAQYIDLRYQKRLVNHLKALVDEATRGLAASPERPRRPQPEGGPRRRVFETVDDEVLIGTESGTGAQRSMAVELGDGTVRHYDLEADNRWALRQAAATQARLADLQAQARVQLDSSEALVLRAEGYARRGMVLASIDDLISNEGRRLLQLATSIERLSTAADDTVALVERLRGRGTELVAQATRLRIRLTKAMPHPTMAHAEYLLGQQAIRLERRAGRVPELDTQQFLQEYVMVDVASGGDLWVAHFHYGKLRYAFDNFAAAHVKRADQARLGAQWEAQNAPARVWRSPISPAQARQYFQPLEP